MEEIYREESSSSNDRKVIAYIAFLCICAMFVHAGWRFVETGRFDPLTWGLYLCLLGLFIWRVCYRYTIILYKNRTMEIITHGLGIRRSYTVDLTRTESFTNKYVRSFFRKTRIGHYIHRYDSLDPNPQRLLVFTEGKKNKLAGVIFKGSDTLLKKLQHMMPDKYIQL